jgi:hypothetical protein
MAPQARVQRIIAFTVRPVASRLQVVTDQSFSVVEPENIGAMATASHALIAARLRGCPLGCPIDP